jgi:hypothetical protein
VQADEGRKEGVVIARVREGVQYRALGIGDSTIFKEATKHGPRGTLVHT